MPTAVCPDTQLQHLTALIERLAEIYGISADQVGDILLRWTLYKNSDALPPVPARREGQ